MFKCTNSFLDWMQIIRFIREDLPLTTAPFFFFWGVGVFFNDLKKRLCSSKDEGSLVYVSLDEYHSRMIALQLTSYMNVTRNS